MAPNKKKAKKPKAMHGLPPCWCGCGAPATTVESDSGDPAAEACTEYALDDDGEPVCGCSPRVVDAGEWTGGGWSGISAGWVSRLRVQEGR